MDKYMNHLWIIYGYGWWSMDNPPRLACEQGTQGTPRTDLLRMTTHREKQSIMEPVGFWICEYTIFRKTSTARILVLDEAGSTINTKSVINIDHTNLDHLDPCS